MREAATHHQAGLKLAAVVATRADADDEFRLAFDGYQRAAGLSSAPVIEFNLAQLYRQTGEYEQAIARYDAFLTRGKPRAAMRRFAECLRNVAVAERAKAAAVAVPPPPPAAPAEPSIAPTVATPEPPPPSPPPPRPSAAPRWYADGLGWGLTGGGVVVAGVGAYFLRDARALERDANATADEAARSDLRDDVRTRRIWGTIGTVAGAALVVTGGIRLALTPERASESQTSLYVTGRGFGVVGRF
jgi:tetratricopeptide (TPR) repeat protein